MSYSVAPIVRTDVAATASSAQGAHHGQESFLVSSTLAIPADALTQSAFRVERFPERERSLSRVCAAERSARMLQSRLTKARDRSGHPLHRPLPTRRGRRQTTTRA